METCLRVASSAIALAAMVLIWNEAPIAESPSDHDVDHRMAYSSRVERPHGAGEPGSRRDRRPERVVRGGRTDAGRAVRPAEPATESGADVDRTDDGPTADPTGGVPDLAH